jgi:hypothetical protein
MRDLQRRFFGLHGTSHRIHNVLSIYFGDINQILAIFLTNDDGSHNIGTKTIISLIIRPSHLNVPSPEAGNNPLMFSRIL